MRIFLVSSEFPSYTPLGGIATYTLHCATGLHALGHEVHVITRSIDDVPTSTQVDGIMHHLLGHGSFPLPQHRFAYPLRKVCYTCIPQTLIRLAWAKEVFKAIAKLIQDGCIPDVIEVPDCGAEGYYLARNALRQKLVVRLHTPWNLVRKLDSIREHPLDSYLLDYCEKLAIRNARYVSSPTKALAEIVCASWHIKGIEQYPNPIPVKNYVKSSGEKWIFVGRVEYRKGVHVLLRAYAQAAQKCTVPQLMLVGKAYGIMANGESYESFIRRLIKELHLEKMIEWIHGTSDVAHYLAMACVAIFPSVWENFSYACLEAMASSIAVIASDCGGFKEIVSSGQNGILFTQEDAAALANELVWCAENPEKTQKMGVLGQLWVATHCDTPVVCKHIEMVYRKASVTQDDRADSV